MSLDGVALVTGAGSGIGRDCAIAFAVEGAECVAFADLNLSTAQRAAEEAKTKATNPKFQAIAIEVNVSREESVELMVKKVQSEFGRIDYSVNSAGIGVQQPRPVSDTSMDEFQAFFDINVKGTMLCVRAVSQVMKLQRPRMVEGRNGPRNAGRGTIVNLGSANSYVATPAIVQYTAAKHAIMGITKTAALDLAHYNIRVNAVCPSWVETPMIERAFSQQQDVFTALVKSLPAGRIATQEEVSDVILFLSGPKSSYVNGVGWIVDGGTTLQMNL